MSFDTFFKRAVFFSGETPEMRCQLHPFAPKSTPMSRIGNCRVRSFVRPGTLTCMKRLDRPQLFQISYFSHSQTRIKIIRRNQSEIDHRLWLTSKSTCFSRSQLQKQMVPAFSHLKKYEYMICFRHQVTCHERMCVLELRQCKKTLHSQ